jgi:two-component system NarL family response regulator
MLGEKRGRIPRRFPAMGAGVRRSPLASGSGANGLWSSGERRANLAATGELPRGKASSGERGTARVYVAAENRLLRMALSRMLMRRSDIEVVGLNDPAPLRTEALLEERADILLMTSRGNLAGDLSVIREIRMAAPAVQILMVGATEEEVEFLQYVRAGIKGYLPRDASPEDVLEAIRELQAGEAVCPGTLCALLFRFLESEATTLPSAAVHQRLGLTRREQQLIPLIAQGLTNKEIANHFCLSEQTVKNHLYRMKHKVGAEDRLGIVQLCRTQGFLV